MNIKYIDEIIDDVSYKRKYLKRCVERIKLITKEKRTPPASFEFREGDVVIYKCYNKDILTISCDDGPAIIRNDGQMKEWRINGVLHRGDNNPAFINEANDIFIWFVNGKLHRTNGPARIDRQKNTFEFYINNVLYHDEEEYWMNVLND